MLNHSLRFAPSNAYVEVPPTIQTALVEGHESSLVAAWADDAAKSLDTSRCGVVFKIGELRLTHESSRQVALAIAGAISKAVQRRGAPRAITVEIDHLQRPLVAEGRQTRFLLPHHDGHHCSYLTPSLIDDPTWQPAMRQFSSEGFYTTKAHKAYQGIFIINPGEGLSVTTYYDWLAIVRDAYTYAKGQDPSEVTQVAHWLGENIRKSLALQPEHKSKYLSLAAALGANELVQHALSLLYVEADFTSEEISRFPELLEFQELAAKSGVSPTECFLNRVLLKTLGVTWAEFREKYEVCVPSERFDYVLGENITLRHGGLLGGPSRLFEPISLVMDHPRGEEYESWLAQAWRKQAFGINGR